MSEDDNRPKRGEPGWTPSKLSHSMAGTYQQCPRRWKNEYVLGIRVGSSLPALVGSFAHEVLEYLYKEDPDDRTIDTSRDIAKYLWPTLEEDDHFIQHQLTDDQVREFKHKVWVNVAGLFQMEDPSRIDVVATEQELHIEIDGVPYKGFVDRLDYAENGVRVVDYKTGKPGADRYWPKKLEQVQLYAAMVREQLGHEPVRVSLLFPSHNTEVGDESTAKKRSRVTNKLKGVWEDIHKSIENDDFPPSVGPLCAWCDFVAECPEGQQEVHALWNSDRVRLDAPAVQVLGLKSRS